MMCFIPDYVNFNVQTLKYKIIQYYIIITYYIYYHIIIFIKLKYYFIIKFKIMNLQNLLLIGSLLNHSLN